MDHADTATEILDTLLGYLGFVADITIDRSGADDITLQVGTADSRTLIGSRGDRLDDIQYLVNRLLQAKDETAPRISVDIDGYRATQEFRIIEEAERMAESVVATGKSCKLPPLNSFYRRIVHNHFKGSTKVKTWSPTDTARLKRITIARLEPSA